jgi:hypothetical protein
VLDIALGGDDFPQFRAAPSHISSKSEKSHEGLPASGKATSKISDPQVQETENVCSARDHTLTRTHLCLHTGLTTPPHLAAFMLLSSSPGSHMSLCPHSPSSCPQQRPDCQGGKVQPPGAVSQHSPCLSSLWLLLACQGTLRPQSSLGAIRPLGLGGNETFTVGRVGMTAPSQPAGPGSLLGSIALSSAPG